MWNQMVTFEIALIVWKCIHGASSAGTVRVLSAPMSRADQWVLRRSASQITLVCQMPCLYSVQKKTPTYIFFHISISDV